MNFFENIKRPESRKLEFKSKFPERSEIVKTLVGFANGSGGNLIIGITDKTREIVGVEDPLFLEEKINNLVYDTISPLISPYITTHHVDGKSVLDIQILPGNNPPYFVKNKGLENGTFIQIGSSNRLATFEIINELKRQSRGIAFEYEIDNSKTIQSLNRKALSTIIKSVDQNTQVNEMTKWKILRKNNGDSFPTIAGLTLFGNSDLLEYDFAAIRLTRFNGIEYSDIAETKEFKIPLIFALDEVYKSVLDNLKKGSVLSGLKRQEKTIIPEFAIREALVNAIVHRDYSNRNSSIKVNIFDNRIEFINPGILYGNIDLSDLGSGISECRNRNMVRIFRKLDLMEELGTGIARIRNLFNINQLKGPLFLEQGNFFKVVFYQEKQESNTPENIIAMIQENGKLSTSNLSEMLNIHQNTVLKHLKKMELQGKILPTGSGRARKYALNK